MFMPQNGPNQQDFRAAGTCSARCPDGAGSSISRRRPGRRLAATRRCRPAARAVRRRATAGLAVSICATGVSYFVNEPADPESDAPRRPPGRRPRGRAGHERRSTAIARHRRAKRNSTSASSATRTSDDDEWARRARVDVLTDPRVVLGASDAGAHMDMMVGAAFPSELPGRAGSRRRASSPSRSWCTSSPGARPRCTDSRDRGTDRGGRARRPRGASTPTSIAPGSRSRSRDLPAGAPGCVTESVGHHRRATSNGSGGRVEGEITDELPGQPPPLRPGHGDRRRAVRRREGVDRHRPRQRRLRRGRRRRDVHRRRAHRRAADLAGEGADHARRRGRRACSPRPARGRARPAALDGVLPAGPPLRARHDGGHERPRRTCGSAGRAAGHHGASRSWCRWPGTPGPRRGRLAGPPARDRRLRDAIVGVDERIDRDGNVVRAARSRRGRRRGPRGARRDRARRGDRGVVPLVVPQPRCTSSTAIAALADALPDIAVDRRGRRCTRRSASSSARRSRCSTPTRRRVRRASTARGASWPGAGLRGAVAARALGRRLHHGRRGPAHADRARRVGAGRRRGRRSVGSPRPARASTDLVTCDMGGTSLRRVRHRRRAARAPHARGELMGVWTALSLIDVESDRRGWRLASGGSTPAACCGSVRGRPGAVPGPACYGRGGTEPTVTDALVVLGLPRPRALPRRRDGARRRRRARGLRPARRGRSVSTPTRPRGASVSWRSRAW